MIFAYQTIEAVVSNSSTDIGRAGATQLMHQMSKVEFQFWNIKLNSWMLY